MPGTPTLLLAAAAGVATHVGYFNRGEHHFYGVRYLQAFLTVCITAIALQVRSADVPTRTALSTTATIAGAFLAGVYASLLTYRIFLHPLNKFPGPFMARITSYWYTFQVAGHARAQDVTMRMHEKYGEFVRVGSSDLSITHPEGVKVVYGLGSKCSKAAWYDNDAPLTSMHTSRNRVMHDRRRRVWSPAFSDKALRGYEERIKPYGQKLVDQLSAFGGKPVNVSEWFNYFSFDVMGDLAFGESFDMLEKGEEHWAVKLLNEGMEPLHLMLPPWTFRILTAIPGLAAGYWKFIGYCSEKLDARMKRGEAGEKDIMSSLLEPYRKTAPPSGDELTYLQGDSRLIIVAGSDTTAATLTHLFYHIAKEPQIIARLREELQTHVDATGNVDHKAIQDAPYLNGCINETLRINPPVPTMVARMTPPEGVTIGDTFVPGNMTVWCPQYVIGRSERIYPNAAAFLPERWYSQPDMITEKTAFAPFSAGVFGCIGRPLALLEIRTVVAKLVAAFDVRFAPGEDGHALVRETRDHFTLGLGDLKLAFEKRKA
ncbi:hypothetical protein FH972_009492 [Carpinus fangiana]|uniref:Cytochrome P450 n=1 Tax=Carpinus fangiana TaxID=176857 RepID=A0A660KRK6_9ROSI|nr:hypothetical protein FH972_009492 [Carpinus fangiana]